MEEMIETLKFLATNPHLSIPLALLLLFWPVAKRAGTMVDRGIGHALPSLFDTRVAVFILLVHLAATIVAAAICFGLTDLPPATFEPQRAQLFGDQAERFMGYMMPVWFAFINMLGVLVGKIDDSPLTKFMHDMLGARMALFGLVGAIGVVAYSAIYDQSPVAPVPAFPNWRIALAWWYTILPLTSILITVSGYLINQLVCFAWYLAGKLSQSSP